jgi:hypothetical protein
MSRLHMLRHRTGALLPAGSADGGRFGGSDLTPELPRLRALAGHWWRRSGALGAAVAVAATPAAGLVITLVPPFGGTELGPGSSWLGTAVILAMLLAVPVAIIAGLTAVVRVTARNRGVRAPGVTAVVLVVMQTVAMVALDRLAPFRPGLLSALLYSAPAMLIAHGVVAGRRARVASTVVALGVFALAVPVCLLQQAVGAWEWTHMGGVPSRTWLQVVNVPGMQQSPYQWDARTQTLTADFNLPAPGMYGGPVETVVPVQNLTPTIWKTAEEYPDTFSCRQQRPGLWACVDTRAAGTAGYVLRSGPVMTVLIGPTGDGLLDAIRAAHPASDSELWSRGGLAPRTVIGWLLL